MNYKNKSHVNSQFYEELINKFFHPQSYFYYSLKNYLKNDSSVLKQVDRSTLQILSEFIHFLLQANQPALELQELSLINGYKNFYGLLESELIKLNIAALDRNQTKLTIQNLALITLQNMIQIVSQNNKRNVLYSYLDLKKRLRLIIDDSNGNGKSKSKISNVPIETPKITPLKNTQSEIESENSISIEDVLSVQQEDNSKFQQFFKKEIDELLAPIAEISTKNSENIPKLDFIKKCDEIFFNINELAIFHDYAEIETISNRVLKLIDTIQAMGYQLSEQVFELILQSKQAIEQCIFPDQNSDALKEIVSKFDDSVSQFEQQLSKQNQTDSSNLPNETPSPEKFPHKTNNDTITNQEFIDNSIKVNDSDVPGSHTNNNLKKDILQFTLPGEDDEDLMKLIQEISMSMSMQSNANKSQIDGIEEQLKQGIVPDKMKPMLTTTDSVPCGNFNNEAQLYVQVILAALTQIKGGKEITSSIDDIELASSSLKHLAKRCEMEKIGFFPELVESICINARAAELEFPEAISEKIEEGVQLINKFDPDNSNQEARLMSILSSLKEYYAYTLSAIEKTPVLEA
ncbi:MAG: hypothetical protein K8R68_08860 [Bacteroidales bacterium]|nr:hypothetical protein [Bacteroidales bacterium]